MIFEMLTYSFMQRALIAGLIVGVICPSIGLFLVLRRMSLVGDSLSHVALSGVAVGMLTGVYPIITALFFTVGAAILIEKLRQSFKSYAELSIAIVLSTGIALAVVIISASNAMNTQLYSYLFGSIATVMPIDVWMIAILGILIMATIIVLYKELFYIALDETSAKLSGVPVKIVNMIFIIMIASTITLTMRIVGILLVSSLIVLPVATSMQIAKSFKWSLIYAILFAQTAIILGMIIAYYYELASGGTIVLLSVFQLIIVLLGKSILKRWRTTYD